MSHSDIYQNKYYQANQLLNQDYIKPFRHHKNFRKQFTQSLQQKQKLIYQKDQNISQPINIYPTDCIKCQICNKYYSYQDAIQHTHYITSNLLQQPIKTIVCQQCPWLCCQNQEKESINRSFKIQENINSQVPKLGLNEVNKSLNEDYSTKVNFLKKQAPNQMEPLYEKLQIVSLSYVNSQIRKPVYYKRQLDIVEQNQDSNNIYIVKQVNGLIGPIGIKKTQYDFDNDYKQTRRIQSSYPQISQKNNQICCSCINEDVNEVEEQNLKKKKQKKIILKKLKGRQGIDDVSNQQIQCENMNYNFNKLQQVFSQEGQFIEQSIKSYGQGCCKIQCQMNCCTQYKKNKIISPLLLNSQYQRNSFFQNGLSKKKTMSNNTRQILYNKNYNNNCPLCGGQKVCSYCASSISKQFKQKIQARKQVSYSPRLKEIDEQNQYKYIWSEHRPWQHQFNEDAFKLCLKDARQRKKITTLKQWQKYVTCQYISK